MKLWIPADRFIEVVDAHARPHHANSITRKLFDLRHGRQEFISLDAADRILTELDLSYLLHVPKERGGLADIYVDGVQYGKPNHSAARLPRPAARKYATEDERRAARLASYRAYYERRKARLAA